MRILFLAAGLAAFFLARCTPPAGVSGPDLTLYTGVVEGFYGDPWTQEERADMITFMGDFGLRHYVYAPKDDPLHRSRWAELYPDSSMAHFGALLGHGRAHGVTIWFAISPGLSMRYSSSEDREALKAKLEQVLDAGFAHIALFFDDVPEQLRHAEDVERFVSLAAAHADVVNDMHAFLEARGAELWVCPTVYAGTFGDPGYLTELGRLVDAEIPLFWTGPDVASPDLPLNEVQAWSERTGRKPLVWDNFPVNDFEVWRPFLGGYPPRDRDGLGHTLGLIANPSPDPYISMPGLATMSALLADPAGYDPESAVETVLPRLFGEEAAPRILPLVKLYQGYGWEDHPFSPLYKPGLPISVSAIEARLQEAGAALSHVEQLSSSDRRVLGFTAEMKRYLSSTRERFGALLADPDYIRSGDELMFNDSLDRYEAQTAASQPVDWLAASIQWHPLNVSGDWGGGRLMMAFQADRETLHAALRLPETDLRPDASGDLFGGDRVTLAVAWDPDTPSTHVTEADPFLVLAAREGGDPVIDRFALNLAGFGARGIADIQLRQVSSFFHQFATYPNSLLLRQIRVDSWTEAGHRYFVAHIPQSDRDKVRMNWSASVTPQGQTRRLNAMAGRRPYLGNPQTWITVHIPE